jgi:hypothetical protein
MISDAAPDLIIGLAVAPGGSLLASNIAHVRDWYTAFLAGPDIPRAWRRSRIDQPK